MTESFILIEENYKDVYERYISITKSKAISYNDKQIVCDDMQFENRNGWCLITLLLGDNFAEDILLKLSDGKRLLYCFSDDVQMDCEFLVIDNSQIIRKKYIYSDTPELDEDTGYLQCEGEMKFLHWNDVDYFINIARRSPEKIFEK